MWSSSVSNTFENDPTLKDILAATYTSSRRSNYAVLNGVDKSIIPVAEELVQQGFNIFMIGNDNDVLEQVKEDLSDIAKENDLNLNIQHISVQQADWVKKDTIKVLEDLINDLDFPCVLINNYRFYSKNFAVTTGGALGVSGFGSPSFILYQSMMKTYPCTLLTEIVGKSFYAMQKTRGYDFGDKTDASKYQALDSLVLKKTNSGKKRAMKKMALLSIKEPIDLTHKIGQKTASERKFLDRHHEFWRTDDNEEEDNEDAKDDKEKDNGEESSKEYMQVIEEFTVHEEKLWDCYQLF